MAKKTKRRRLSKDETKQKMTQTGGGGNWFKLPEGIELWSPEKKGNYVLNVLPYEVTTENHPEEGIEAGVLWFRTQLRIHHGIGAQGQSIVCPRSVGKKCIICAEADRLRKEDKDANEDAIKELSPQLFVIMNIVHPDDEDKFAVLVLSYGKFDKVLRQELQEEENEEHLDFYQCDIGKTLKVRFSEASFAGNKYLEATRITFKEREEMDEDEILASVADLDKIINVMPAEKIESIFLEGEEDEDEDEDDPPKAKAKPKKKKTTKKKTAKKSKPDPEPEEDDDDEDEEEDEDDDSWIDNGMEDDEEEEEEDDDDFDDDEDDDEDEDDDTDDEDEDDEEEEEEEEEEDDDDEDWDDEDDDDEDEDDDEDWDDDEEEEEFEIPDGHIECKACSENDVPGENSKGGQCVPCKGKGYVKKPAAKKKKKVVKKTVKRARKKK